MDWVRFGLGVRALRRRKGWTQEVLVERVGMSQSTVSRLEVGEGDTMPGRDIEKVVTELGARLRLTQLAHGEDLDRLLDASHAELVEMVTALLRRLGLEVEPEVTFSIFGERGSIDILAFHAPTGSLLVIEVKSAIPDVQATLAGIDRKVRLAGRIAKERGWQVRTVSRWLVVPDDMTTRRRVAAHQATFDSLLPQRTVALRRWAHGPQGSASGILFVSDTRRMGGRHRIGRPRRDLASGTRAAGRCGRIANEHPSGG
jgi:transcriptional regulator with XRE-family HTH domain